MEHYQTYVDILNEELMPAMGCTEPIAIAYCASLVKDTLKALPSEVIIKVSGNIIKNVKSVVVPHTNGMQGIKAAAGIGLLGGNSSKELEVIAHIPKEIIAKLPEYLNNTKISVEDVDNEHTLYIEITGIVDNNSAKVIIQDSHTHVYSITLNNKVIYLNEKPVKKNESNIDKSVLNVKDIVEFANIVNIDDVKATLDRQIEYNWAIAKEGIHNNYGANIGKTLITYGKNDTVQYCKALAAAASDARMNGCEMPVVINSGSGNQGITCSVPVLAYAKKPAKIKN